MSMNFSLLKYRNPVFVETGTNMGYGVRCAVDAGFKKIYSIELSRDLYGKCNLMYKKEIQKGNVELFLGDSGVLLADVLKKVDSRATFWLDAHYSGPGTDTVQGDEDVPLFRELNIIEKHHVKTHTILIDDVRDFGGNDGVNWSAIRLDSVVEKLKKINPDYRIFFERGSIPNDVLVAEIPGFRWHKILGKSLEISYPPTLKILQKFPLILKLAREMKGIITR